MLAVAGITTSKIVSSFRIMPELQGLHLGDRSSWESLRLNRTYFLKNNTSLTRLTVNALRP